MRAEQEMTERERWEQRSQEVQEWLEQAEYLWLPLDQLHVADDEHGYARRYGPGSLEGDDDAVAMMTARWRADLAWPLLVNRRADGSYWVMDGHLRLLAARRLGLEAAYCAVIFLEDWRQEAQVCEVANKHEPDPTVPTVAARLYPLVEDYLATHPGEWVQRVWDHVVADHAATEIDWSWTDEDRVLEDPDLLAPGESVPEHYDPVVFKDGSALFIHEEGGVDYCDQFDSIPEMGWKR
jgi:hypothetical protein